MRIRFFARALFVSTLGLGVMAGLARADQGPPAGTTAAPSSPPVVQPMPGGQVVIDAPVVSMADAGRAPEAAGYRHPIRELFQSHPIKTCIHNKVVNHPWYCYATHNDIGCGSCKAECTFIFGSCRAFYGEACRKGPDFPPGYGYGPGSGQSGCRCP